MQCEVTDYYSLFLFIIFIIIFVVVVFFLAAVGVVIVILVILIDHRPSRSVVLLAGNAVVAAFALGFVYAAIVSGRGRSSKHIAGRFVSACKL